MKEALIIFARNPEAGKVKTRLAATIGNDSALAIYNRLIAHTASVSSELGVDKFVFYSNHISMHDTWNDRIFLKEIQQGIDLGERMEHAFDNLFQRGFDKIVIVGTDCPELTSEIITKAFTCLDKHDVAFGPASDGGYYLLGMNKFHPSLFKNIPWSTNRVLKETTERCDSLKLKYALLPMLHDIDDEKDLIHLKKKRVQDSI